MSMRTAIIFGVLILSLGLAVVLGSRLPNEYLVLGFGIALGVGIGVLVGGGGMFFILRNRALRDSADNNILVNLTSDQANQLFKALERQQASPESLTQTAGSDREFKSVGGGRISTYDSSDT